MNKQAGALFAAIVAVGLGPAVWLGGTLLRGDPVPAAPVPVSTPEITESPSPSPSEPEPEPEPEPTETLSPTPAPTEELDPDGVWTPPGGTASTSKRATPTRSISPSVTRTTTPSGHPEPAVG
ncbi:hypothetical protein SAMN05444365_11340 [Micromonospora pattaloongensis]|uniref:Uncharacterized protein n=1 Tax=Micromonospora pattaloongensis TaxID=405436 RepID=A0A1H3SR35_9ACTN|nr:hypothetical protein [Micromonospora pattaloongensis]SDZ40035.1 hypothetical protein SAMN05444365_11340 [Micromonospora pattaloongensis]